MVFSKRVVEAPASFKAAYFFAAFSVWPAQNWAAIALMLAYASLAMWVIEGATNDDDFPGVSAADGLKQSAFYQAQVRRTPRWPRSWANFSVLWLYSHRNAWANLHLLGQPNTFLARSPCSVAATSAAHHTLARGAAWSWWPRTQSW
jgi:hypothetical protein